MKTQLTALIVAVIYYMVSLSICFAQGYIVNVTTHVRAWNIYDKYTLYYVPLVMFGVGLCISVDNFKREK